MRSKVVDVYLVVVVVVVVCGAWCSGAVGVVFLVWCDARTWTHER